MMITIMLMFAVYDKAGKGPLFHCMHSTGRHVKCMGLLLEMDVDPNTTVSSKS